MPGFTNTFDYLKVPSNAYTGTVVMLSFNQTLNDAEVDSGSDTNNVNKSDGAGAWTTVDEGTNKYISLDGGDTGFISDNSGLDAGNKLTVALWVDPDNANTEEAYINKRGGGGSQNSWTCYQWDSGRMRFNFSNSGSANSNSWTAQGVIATGWQHIGITWDASSAQVIKIYRNGIQQGLDRDDGVQNPLFNSSSDIMIGAYNQDSPGAHFSGNMDDIIVDCDTAYTSNQIFQLWQMGRK